MWNSLPELGSVVLCAVLVTAAFTFGVALRAADGRPRWLASARLGAYGTIALVGVAVLLLAYAFVAHDFRIRYVTHYSSRSMSTALLLAALWGGQDGSLLWWLFLTCLFTGAAIHWMKGRYRELQPYVIATLMVVLVFLSIVMLFAVNPFATVAGGAPADGKGLNHQLRNFYMIVHPPALYLGFTSAAVPFAFAVAALVTGRLGNEWIVASRKWMLFSWLFLTIGNGLGMIWAYEELGWGGYWNWDPVENASLLPWLTATAYLHSITMQERRGMFKHWNVLLVCATFFLTLFGTFITRSGLIASVHAFSKSSIGTFFLVFMLAVIVGALVLWILALLLGGARGLLGRRRDRLANEAGLESGTSRESAFLAQNWLQLGITLFVTAATLWPTLSEWLLRRKATVGPAFYNTFVPPLALLVIALMGLAPLLGWRRTSRELFVRSIRAPAIAGLAAAALHLGLGRRLGVPAFVEIEPALHNWLGTVMAAIVGKLPVVTVALVVFNVTVVVQEFARGVRARRARQSESVTTALVTLIGRSRRRYGGYLVHVGIAVMFLGFAGRAWGTNTESSLRVGQQVTVGNYTLTYVGMRETRDEEKQMLFADVDVQLDGKSLGRLGPAKVVYDDNPEQPSSEVGLIRRWNEDLYVIVGMLSRRDEVASFQIHVNPLVSLVWLGIILASLAGLVAMWPEGLLRRAGAFGYVRRLETQPGAAK